MGEGAQKSVSGGDALNVLGGEGLWLAKDGRRFLARFVPLVMLLALLVTLRSAVVNGELRFNASGGLLLGGICAVGWAMLLRGKVRMALLGLLWASWVFISVWGFYVMGVRTPLLYGYPLFIMLSGWIAGRWTAFAMGVASVGVLSVLLWGERAGWLTLNYPRQAEDYYLTLAAVCILAALLAGFIGEGFKRQFNQHLVLAEDLQAQVVALKHSEDRFFHLFDMNPMPCMLTREADGLIYEVNEAWERAFGWPRSDVRGKTTVEIGLWLSGAARQRLFADLPQAGRLSGLLLALWNSRGEPRTYALSCEVMEMDGERRLVAAMLDQTDRLRAEEAVRALNTSLEARVAERTAELHRAVEMLKETQDELVHAEKLASLGALVAGISHELNTPIGNTLITASTLQEQVRELERLVARGELRKSALNEFVQAAGEMSDLLVRSCQRATELIASFKQVAVDQASERRRRFDLKEVVEDVLKTLRPSFKLKPWVLETDIPEGLACDSFPGPLGQVLSNLVQNACVHAFDDRPQGKVSVSASLERDGQVRLTVQDDGVGMDAVTLSRVFDPFFTTRLGKGGSGLGLFVSHRVVTSILSGSLQADSRPGEGSVFTLIFPVVAPESL